MRLMFTASVLVLFVPAARTAPPPPADPWVGAYVKYERGPGGEAQRKFTISKRADGSYELSGQYASYRFKETEKGVLSDGKGGIGSLHLGSMTFGDGKSHRVLRAEFCYEQFLLHNLWQDADPEAKPARK